MGDDNEAQIDATQVATTWLAQFQSAISSKAIDAIADLFLSDGFLRDVFIFSWDARTLQGRTAIKDYLSANFRNQKLSSFEVYEDNYLVTKLDTSIPGFKVVDFTYAFETENAKGRGGIKLMPGDKAEKTWKALSVFTTVADWKGYEEGKLPKLWVQDDSDPEVLISACISKKLTFSSDPSGNI